MNTTKNVSEINSLPKIVNYALKCITNYVQTYSLLCKKYMLKSYNCFMEKCYICPRQTAKKIVMFTSCW